MTALFKASESKLVADTVSYSDWFARQDERTQRLAVGSKRFDVMRDIAGPRLDWSKFIDPDSGELLSVAALKTEGKRMRERRIKRVQAALAQRREAIKQIQMFGFLRAG